MITIIYPKKAHIYCFHNDRKRHRVKDNTTGYQCGELYCRKKICGEHWEEHQAEHMMRKLAR